MSFLSPFTAALAAAIAIPALLLLYFLKLRRRYLRIASTLLWKQSYEDLEVNAPFQRLKWSALLVLQLAALLTLLLAMAQPIVQGEPGGAARLVLIIDRSASMNAVDAGEGRSRLDAAKDAVRETIERLGRSGAAREVMLIAYGSTAHVASTFQFDRATLLNAIDNIEPTHEEANLSAALQLASGFAGHSEDAGDQQAQVVLISDGVVERPDDSAGFRLRSGAFRFVRVGPDPDQAADNIGIAAFSARRELDDPARVVVFARLVSSRQEPVELVVTLRLDGEAVDVRLIEVPAAQPDGATGEAPVTFAIEHPGGGVLTLHHNRDDALAADNRAHLVLPPPIQPRIAIISGRERPSEFLYRLVENFDPMELVTLSPERFDALDQRELDAGAYYDLVIFDAVSNHRLPGVPSMTFGGTPRGVGEVEPSTTGGRLILSWDRQHPIMRHVPLDRVAFTGFGAYELPPGATSLASGPDGSVIAALATRGARHVLVGFPLDTSRTNWSMDLSIAIFMQNVRDYLTLVASGQVGLVHKAGQPITVRARPDASALVIAGPVEARLPVEPGAMRTLPALRASGVYEVAGANPPMDRIAVSVLSDRESDIRPRTQLLVNAEPASAGPAEQVVPRELWPWALAAALVLLVLEWLTYCRKSR